MFYLFSFVFVFVYGARHVDNLFFQDSLTDQKIQLRGPAASPFSRSQSGFGPGNLQCFAARHTIDKT
jgi:hypothetical protein